MQVAVRIPRPYALQNEILRDKARFKVVCAGRRIGKSILCQIAAVEDMLKGRRVCFITPTYTHCAKVYAEILQRLPFSLISVQNKSNREIKLKTGGSINFFSGQSLDRTRGYEFDLLIVDECSFIPTLGDHWMPTLRPLLIATIGRAIFVSTPKGKNFFYSLFMKGRMCEEDFKSWQFSTLENPHLPPSEFDSLVSGMTDGEYQQEILAVPTENQDGAFNLRKVEQCVIDELSDKEPIVFGVDLASKGDYTVIIGMDEDGSMCYFDRFKGEWELIYERLRRLDMYIPKVLDNTGVGSPTVQRLQSELDNVSGFDFSASSKPKIIRELILDVETNQIKFNRAAADEMSVYEYKWSPSGHISYNAQSGFHDDIICALAIANKYRKRLGFDEFYVF